MTELGNERVAYFNGEILPESRVAISFRDTGFLYGDGVFDTTRTFGHKPFRLGDHVRRLFRSLKATGTAPWYQSGTDHGDHRRGARAQPAPDRSR